jgi:hypothetical protein
MSDTTIDAVAEKAIEDHDKRVWEESMQLLLQEIENLSQRHAAAIAAAHEQEGRVS